MERTSRADLVKANYYTVTEKRNILHTNDGRLPGLITSGVETPYETCYCMNDSEKTRNKTQMASG